MNTLKKLTAILAMALILVSCGNEPAFKRAGLMEGAPNFRDLGNYPSAGGKKTAARKIFRSEKLSELSDADLETIRALGIKTVIDFRGDDEVAEDPSRLPEGVEVVRLPIEVGKTSNLPVMQQLAAGTLDSAACVGFMQTANRQFVVEFTQQYRDFFALLLRAENYPVVFHCTAGKDRTGFAAALLLSVLGVDRDTVMSDYLLTNRYLKPQLLSAQIPEDALPALRQMWGVQPSFLNAARDEITQNYGTIDNYLTQELNVGETEKATLKRLLLK